MQNGWQRHFENFRLNLEGNNDAEQEAIEKEAEIPEGAASGGDSDDDEIQVFYDVEASKL